MRLNTLLVDSYNRRIDYLRISVTDRCNLRCIYCMPPEGVTHLHHKEVLRYEEILKIASIALGLGIKKIRVTGGEPLVRKDILYLISRLSKLEGIEELCMTTNGILLPSMAHPLREAGLHRINISLDSLSPERYREITRGGELKRVLEGIEAAMGAGFNMIKINMVVMKGINSNEVADFARLTLDSPLEVRFIEWMPMGRGTPWDKEKIVSSDTILSRLREEFSIIPVDLERTSGPAQIYRIKGGKGRIGFISPITNHFCRTCNRLRLTADGQLRTCLFSNSEVNLKAFIRRGIDDKALRDILEEAIRQKPKGHSQALSKGAPSIRWMNSIGG